MPPPLFVAERRNGSVTLSTELLPLAFTLPGLRSNDGHELTAYVRTAVRILRTPADEQLFSECFLAARQGTTADDVKRHLTGPLSAEAAAFVSGYSADAAIAQADVLRMRLSKRLEAAGFACGLAPTGLAEVTLDSDTLRGDRQQNAARQRQLDAAEHAAKLVEKLAAAGPAHRLAVADQAALLPSLLAAEPVRRVLLAAGPNVVAIDADESVRIVPMPEAVGPLRCVRDLGDGQVAVGGTKGVALRTADLQIDQILPAGDSSGRGFNAIARLGEGQIAATHGELGLAVWKIATRDVTVSSDSADTPQIFATPGPARGLVPLSNGRLALAAGGVVWTFDGTTLTPAFTGNGAATALMPVGDTILAVQWNDGSLTLLDASTLQPLPAFGAMLTDAPVTAAAGLPAGGLRALLVSDARGVRCLAADGQPLGRLPLPGGCRMLAVAGGRIVGVGPDRATVHVWDAATPEAAARTIHVLARTGNHVTDLTTAPLRTGSSAL